MKVEAEEFPSTMILTPRCTYNPDPEAHETKCGICGKPLQYEHTVIGDDGTEFAIGIDCIHKLQRDGKITKRERRNGRIDWTLKDVREDALWDYRARTLS